jgi:hypothetical protein
MKLIFAGIGEDCELIHRFRTCYQECAEAKRNRDANGRALLAAAHWADEKEGPAKAGLKFHQKRTPRGERSTLSILKTE